MLREKERDKRKKTKFTNLLLSEEEFENLPKVVKVLNIVKTGSKRLCANDVTLSTADRVNSLERFN